MENDKNAGAGRKFLEGIMLSAEITRAAMRCMRSMP